MLPGPFSFVQPALKPRWGDAESDGETLNLNGGMLTLDGGRVPPTYLSTDFEQYENLYS